MKIDVSFLPNEGTSRAPASSSADHQEMGNEFGKAVRDAGDQKSSPSLKSDQVEDKGPSKPSDREIGSSNEPSGEKRSDARSDTVAGSASEVTDGAEPEKKVSSADLGSLHSLLGALAGQGAAKAFAKASSETIEETDPQPLELPVAAEPDAQTALQGETDGVGGEKSMRLDVLRMETHFEPHQDGMVLVESAAPAERKGAKDKVGAHMSALQADKATAQTIELPKAKAADVAASKDEGAPIRISFGEAVARLGRGGGERSGEQSSRDGSAASQSALVELAARRGDAEVVEVTAASGATALGTTASASPFGLAGQVAGPIIDALGDGGQAPAPASAPNTDAHLRMRAGGGALKTLTIQLHPEHLGTVDVSLRLNEGRLTLELAASQSDTAAMLLDDRTSLRKLLEHAGFSLDDAAISVVTRDSGQVRTSEGTDTGAQSRNPSGDEGNGDRSNGRDPSSASGEQQPRRRSERQAGDEPVAARSASGNTYL